MTVSEKIVTDPSSNGKGLNSNFINCLYNTGDFHLVRNRNRRNQQDQTQNLSIQNYSHNDQDQSTISRNPVNVILEDSDAQLWVGTVEGGLNMKNEGEETFSLYRKIFNTTLS